MHYAVQGRRAGTGSSLAHPCPSASFRMLSQPGTLLSPGGKETFVASGIEYEVDGEWVVAKGSGLWRCLVHTAYAAALPRGALWRHTKPNARPGWRREALRANVPLVSTRLPATLAAGASRITWKVVAPHTVAVLIANEEVMNNGQCLCDDEQCTRYTCDLSRIANQAVRTHAWRAPHAAPPRKPPLQPWPAAASDSCHARAPRRPRPPAMQVPGSLCIGRVCTGDIPFDPSLRNYRLGVQSPLPCEPAREEGAAARRCSGRVHRFGTWNMAASLPTPPRPAVLA